MSVFAKDEASGNENRQPINGGILNLEDQQSPSKSNLESLSSRYTPASRANPLRSVKNRVSLSRPSVSPVTKTLDRKSSKRKLEEIEDHNISYCQIYDEVSSVTETNDFTAVVKAARTEYPSSPSSPSSPSASAPAPAFSSVAESTTNASATDASVADASVTIKRNSLVQCVIKRLRATILEKMYPSYEMYDNEGQLLMVAKKMKINKTYHFYRAEYSKKSGISPNSNYMGKLQAGKDNSKIQYSLFNNDRDEHEVGAIIIERVSLAQSITEYVPRKMRLIVPELDPDLLPKGLPKKSIAEDGKEPVEQSLLDAMPRIESNEKFCENYPVPHNPIVFKSKKPTMKDGKYFLNFNGRVKMGSLKNFQMVEELDDDLSTRNIACQFGKFSENEFNLDYKEPITPMQAFALCLVQFEL